MMNSFHNVVFSAILLATVVPARAGDAGTADWSSFRNGGSSAIAGSLPASWSPTEGVAWQVETDGYGQSAPIIVDNTVYVTSAVGSMKEQCAVTAIDLSSGATLWQKRISAAARGPSNYMNSRGAPTPVADETGVYAFFESGDLLAFNSQGTPIWHRNLTKDLGPFESNHGLGSSLAQSDDLLFLNLEHKGPSKLIAVRKSDGYITWQAPRPSGSSWTSPVATAESVIVSSAGTLTAYRSATGKQQWTVEGLDGNSVPSPCVVGDHIYTGARIPEFGSASDASKSNLCVRIVRATPIVGSSEQTGNRAAEAAPPKSESATAKVVWKSGGAVCDYASPVVTDGRVYYLNKVGVLSCVDAETGKQLYRNRLSAECWATPVVADNGIYFFAKNGTTKVVAHGPEFRLLQTNQLWDLENPPAPKSYREAERTGHGHGGGGHSTDQATTQGSDHQKHAQDGKHAGDATHTPSQRGPGGMIAALMIRDANNDGILQEYELSADFRPMLKRVDTNGDGSLDQEELAAMAKSFAERRKHSRASSRDPIVYGVAAVPGAIVVRTGTRLYCITDNSPSLGSEDSQ